MPYLPLSRASRAARTSASEKTLGRLHAPAGEHLVGVVAVVVVVVAAARIMVMVVVAVLMLVVVMMVAVLMLVVVMMVAMLVLVVVVMMAMLVLVMVVLLHLVEEGVALLHGLQDLRAGELIQGVVTMTALGFFSLSSATAAESFSAEMESVRERTMVPAVSTWFVVELAEVLHIHLTLAGVGHGDHVAKLNVVGDDLLHGCLHIAELAHAGGLDEDAVGGIVVDDLSRAFPKSPTRLQQMQPEFISVIWMPASWEEAAVDADFTKLILNEHNFLACIGFLDHLLDESGFASTQETGVNVNFRP